MQKETATNDRPNNCRVAMCASPLGFKVQFQPEEAPRLFCDYREPVEAGSNPSIAQVLPFLELWLLLKYQ
jgi:hypothetical protein